LALAALQSVLERFEQGGGAAVEVTLETTFDPAQLNPIAQRTQATLVVVGPWPTRSPRSRVVALLELASRHGVDVLSVGSRCGAPPARLGRVGLSVQPDSESLGATAATVRTLPHLEHLVAFVHQSTAEAWDATEARLRALFPGTPLELVPIKSRLPSLAEDLQAAAQSKEVDLLVVASDDISSLSALVTGLMSATVLEEATRPLLVLHRREETGLFTERLTCTDTLALPGARRRLLLERVSALGRTTLAEGERFTVVGAEDRGTLPHDHGVVGVPHDWVPTDATHLALSSSLAPDMVATASVLPQRPLVLIDAGLPLESLADVEPLAREHTLVFVRLRASETLEAVHSRLDTVVPWGGPVPLLDASVWLDDAGAPDVPQAVDALRLMRLALRFAARGAEVRAIVTRDEHPPRSDAVTTWTPLTLARRSPTAPLSRPAPRVVDAESGWQRLTGAALTGGHSVQLELDNHRCRARTLEDLAAAKQRIHWQCYIVEEDPIAEEVVRELEAAGRRGVQVRVLVDALYSRHEAFGAKNPVLERLTGVPNVQVLGYQPLSGLPSLTDLKQRNHRKLVIIDGAKATVSGRNLGAPYYRGFDEVTLTGASSYRDVPWVDASLVLEGPLVEQAERAFCADWVRSGGEAFAISPVPPAGNLACRLVLHEGLLDAHSFDAQLELMRTAKRRVLLMNTFPLVLELQRALLDALHRGVQVQLVFGSVRPRWGEDLPFDGGGYRELADELVRSKLEPLLRGGAEGYEVAKPWPAPVGRLFPPVHAKVYLRDDDCIAVGSANVDVTSAYWESEALLFVEDRDFVARALEGLAPVFAQARRVDLSTEAWTKDETRRQWLGRNWPSLMS
jgi:phosphatidylserine/phosphatidylglycerophosphate/cardiolipin synthase-like enzyme